MFLKNEILEENVCYKLLIVHQILDEKIVSSMTVTLLKNNSENRKQIWIFRFYTHVAISNIEKK